MTTRDVGRAKFFVIWIILMFFFAQTTNNYLYLRFGFSWQYFTGMIGGAVSTALIVLLVTQLNEEGEKILDENSIERAKRDLGIK